MVLITGATGTFGAHLAFKLLETENKIVAIKRETSSTDRIKKIFSFYTDEYQKLYEKIKWIDADITNYSQVYTALKNITKVYHCAAHVSFKNVNKSKFISTNIEGTRNIVNACLENNVKKLVHLSSISALGLNKNGITTEADSFDPQQEKMYYGLTKYYGELEIYRGIEEGLNAVIVNPSIIIAPYILNKKGVKIFNIIAKKGIKRYTTGIKDYIDVNDLAKIVHILMESNIVNEKFIASAENLSFKQMITYFNEAIDKSAPHKLVHRYFLNILKIMNTIITLGNPTINKKLVHYAYSTERYSSEKLLSKIDFKFTTLEDSIKQVVEIYKNKL